MNDKMTELRRRAMQLPATPGVYIMYNIRNEIIYVGKSKALCNRVSQYFSNTAHNVKTTRMVSAVDHFEFILTETEIEALNLENRLIKLHMPRYNILLKDDKNYPYLKVTVADDYPKIEFVRKRIDDGARYFGPYPGGVASSILRTVYRVFGLPRCNQVFPRDIGKKRPCIYSQLGQCMAPCSGELSKEEYREVIEDVISFLRGSIRKVRESLAEKMNYAAENMLFETAAVYRDRIRVLERLWDKQNVVGSPDDEFDVFSLYEDERCSCIVVFYIREGALCGSDHFVFGADKIVDASAMAAFICSHYTTREYVPQTVLLGVDIGEELDFVSRFLAQRSGRSVYVHVPMRGTRKALCNMALNTAKQYADQFCAEKERDNKTLIKLASLLGLETVPERIEAYDISNFASDEITAGMITVFDGKFRKKDYRLYKITDLKTPDDYASMRQAVSRRLGHPELPYPDLILLDGGKGHVGVVRGLLYEKGIDIPVFGMVKDEYHKTRALVDDEREISIAKEQSVFQLIYKIQEEVHRFSITAMEKAKTKRLKHSSLESIPGIGPAKAKQLLSSLSTLAAIKSADVDTLATVKGITRQNAEDIYNYFREKEHKNK